MPSGCATRRRIAAAAVAPAMTNGRARIVRQRITAQGIAKGSASDQWTAKARRLGTNFSRELSPAAAPAIDPAARRRVPRQDGHARRDERRGDDGEPPGPGPRAPAIDREHVADEQEGPDPQEEDEMGACEGGEPQQEGGRGSLPPPLVLLPGHQLLEPRHARAPWPGRRAWRCRPFRGRRVRRPRAGLHRPTRPMERRAGARAPRSRRWRPRARGSGRGAPPARGDRRGRPARGARPSPGRWGRSPRSAPASRSTPS